MAGPPEIVRESAGIDALRQSAGIDMAPEVMSDLLDRWRTASPDDMAARAPMAISDLPDRLIAASPDSGDKLGSVFS